MWWLLWPVVPSFLLHANVSENLPMMCSFMVTFSHRPPSEAATIPSMHWAVALLVLMVFVSFSCGRVLPNSGKSDMCDLEEVTGADDTRGSDISSRRQWKWWGIWQWWQRKWYYYHWKYDGIAFSVIPLEKEAEEGSGVWGNYYDACHPTLPPDTDWKSIVMMAWCLLILNIICCWLRYYSDDDMIFYSFYSTNLIMMFNNVNDEETNQFIIPK